MLIKNPIFRILNLIYTYQTKAFLRMDNSATDDDKNKRVEDIMHDVIY